MSQFNPNCKCAVCTLAKRREDEDRRKLNELMAHLSIQAREHYHGGKND